MLSSPAELTSFCARRYGERLALITPYRRLTFSELDRLSSQFAGRLQGEGVGPGDTVSLLSENRWEWVVAYHAVLKLGAIVNPLNALLAPSEVTFAVSDCGSSLVIGSVSRLAGLRDMDRPTMSVEEAESSASSSATPSCERRDPSAVASIGYTSGTTGHPKGAMQSGTSLVLNWAYTSSMHGRSAEDVVVSALPCPHVYGNVVIHSSLLVGARVILMERFDASEALSLIAGHKATMFEGVPAMYALLEASPDFGRANLTSLTRCTVGGQTIAASVVDTWEKRSQSPLIELWGMTELSGLGTTHSVWAPNRRGSIGVALPGHEARIAVSDSPERRGRPGEAGELLIRGPLVMLGYLGREDDTKKAIDADGWLHTGDVAIADRDGWLRIVDRLSDVILCGGYNLYPAEIERVLMQHPKVALAGVGRVSDEIMGELPHAYVVPKGGATIDVQDVANHCATHLAKYKLPRAIHVVEDLPMTSSGKIMRRLLQSPPRPPVDGGSGAPDLTT